ncbi:DUF4832 domain-containing protein [Sphingomonas sp. 8AM]|uniref:DUF4832 domain-containing protein n=1 Tax=Sphingomonas sp. 8AM TaxID=2653170 RepID=UPI0012F1BF48|nr:DUF4832 domain-containing protein [Sphingomonas sp. 8AM]VXC99145.1 conserved hypothetical protein [Sphingomonas sp. 8AM]
MIAPAAMLLAMQTVTLTPSDAEIANPERGFYRAGNRDLAALDQASLERVYAGGERLVYARIDLVRYRNAPIEARTLDGLARGFAAARAAGVKLIVRAVYNYPHGETDYHAAQDAPLSVVRAHLAQLQPLFAANADVIAFVQAGFIGAWGEWHSSSNDLTSTPNRRAVRDALLAAVPRERSIQFRYPPDLITWGPMQRIGFHNDCFMASQTDVGTFSEEPAQRVPEQAAMARLTADAPFGGETCNPADDPGAIPRTGCAAIRDEGARYHLSYLNADYYRRLFHDRWIAGGCMAEVQRKLGYRFALVSASIAPRAQAGGEWPTQVAIRNEGWARLTNARPLQIVLIERDGGAMRRLTMGSADPRAWLPGAVTTVKAAIRLPVDLAPGAYDIALALPDDAPALRDNPRFAIRFANEDRPDRGQGWQNSAGLFRIGLTLQVEKRRQVSLVPSRAARALSSPGGSLPPRPAP